MSSPRLRLGQLLVDAKLVTQQDLDEVLALQRVDGRKIGALLVERGKINETQLTQILSHQLSVPWVSLLHIEFSRQLLNLVPHDVAERFCVVPIYVRHVRNQGETLYVAMDDPSNEDGLKACSAHSGLPVRAMIAPPADIRAAIRVYYQSGSKRPADVAPPKIEPAPVTAPSRVIAETTAPAAEAEAPAAPPASEEAPPPSSAPVIDVAEATESRPIESDPPQIEAVELELPPRRPGSRPRIAPLESEPPPSAAQVDSIPVPRGGAPRMVSLTLLDGTTITLPARRPRGRRPPATPVAEVEARPDADDEPGLTARDLVSALRAVSHGADASEILGNNVRWEAMFAALLSLLLKKHLIADWEFVDELKRI